MSDVIFLPRSNRSKYDPGIYARRPTRSPSSPLLITTSIAALKLSANTNKLLSKVIPPKKEPPVSTKEVEFAKECVENYKKVDFVSLGGFLKSCLSCEKKMDDKDDIYMFRNLEAFCSENCRGKYIEAVEKQAKQRKDYSDSTVSEAFKSYDVTKLRRLGQ